MRLRSSKLNDQKVEMRRLKIEVSRLKIEISRLKKELKLKRRENRILDANLDLQMARVQDYQEFVLKVNEQINQQMFNYGINLNSTFYS